MLVVFDFDGTLVDINERWYQLHINLANKYSLPIIERQTYLKTKKKGVKEELTMLDYSNDLATIKEYCAERISLIEDQHYLDFDQPFQHVFEALKTWSKLGPMSLISKRRSAENFHWEINKKGFKPFFQQHIPTLGKEKGEILCQKYTQQELASAVMISDAYEDYKMAQDLGMNAVAIGYGCRNTAFFQEKGIQRVLQDCIELEQLGQTF